MDDKSNAHASSSTFDKEDELSVTASEDNEQTVELWEKINYKWKVKNVLSSLEKEVGYRLQSPIFSSSIATCCKWYISFYPNGKTRRVEDCVSLFLRLVSGPKDMVTKFSLSVKSTDEELLTAHYLEATFPPGGLAWGWYNFADRESLLASTESGQLIIQAKIKVKFDKPMCKSERLGGFDMILSNPKFSDVELCAGDKKIPAHKNILAARSTVFAEKFYEKCPMTEPEKIDIIDLSPAFVVKMLTYIYTNEVDIQDIATAEKLLKAATLYGVGDLESVCIDYLTPKLDLSNVVHVYYLADSCNASGLKEYAAQYISDNSDFFKQDSSQFQLLEERKPKLLTELVLRIMKEKSS